MRGQGIRVLRKPALVTFLGSLALLLVSSIAPATAATIVTPVNLNAVIVASHAPVSPAGGEVLVHINIRGASWCRVVISPPVRIRPLGLACHNLENAYRATIGLNPRLQKRRFVLSVIAEGSHRQTVRHLVIEQSKAPSLIDNYTRVSTYGVYGNGENDAVGDCTLATAADLLQTWDAMNGLANGPLATQPFLDAYHTLVGGSGGPNVGLTASQVLNYWQHTGIDNNLIASWHSINAYRNPAQIEDAIARNGALYASVALPSTDANFLPIWSMVGAPYGTPVAGGHALAIVGYDARGPYFATWGGVQHATWQWWKTWGTGAFVIKPAKTLWTPNVVNITSTTLTETINAAPVNGASVYALNLVAEVAGLTGPTSATISFSDNGQLIIGCTALPVVASGATLTASCTEYISSVAYQSDTLFAQFSGDSAFGDSTSNPAFVAFG